ncbi:MAG: hypothetical protein Q7K54_06520 [Candidatus Parcubacteria bacterium]|nr:hypothetical protein [Candidatus Parcubacteria bacterium]
MDINNLGQIPGMPKAITINIEFDLELQKITGTEGHDVVMSEGSMFMFLLQSIFMEYPKIEKKYPPGMLGFIINGTPPKTYTPLFDGDVVSLSVGVY